MLRYCTAHICLILIIEPPFRVGQPWTRSLIWQMGLKHVVTDYM